MIIELLGLSKSTRQLIQKSPPSPSFSLEGFVCGQVLAHENQSHACTNFNGESCYVKIKKKTSTGERQKDKKCV